MQLNLGSMRKFYSMLCKIFFKKNYCLYLFVQRPVQGRDFERRGQYTTKPWTNAVRTTQEGGALQSPEPMLCGQGRKGGTLQGPGPMLYGVLWRTGGVSASFAPDWGHRVSPSPPSGDTGLSVLVSRNSVPQNSVPQNSGPWASPKIIKLKTYVRSILAVQDANVAIFLDIILKFNIFVLLGH